MAFGLDDAVAGVASLLTTAIDKIWPDPADKAKAEAVAMAATADAAIRQLQAAQAVMQAEAQSADPWTSRARPSFLYVMYALILWSVPMGILSVFSPTAADALVKGMTGYLAAIPEPLYALFGTGYLGYTVARQWGKAKGTDK